MPGMFSALWVDRNGHFERSFLVRMRATFLPGRASFSEGCQYLAHILCGLSGFVFGHRREQDLLGDVVMAEEADSPLSKIQFVGGNMSSRCCRGRVSV